MASPAFEDSNCRCPVTNAANWLRHSPTGAGTAGSRSGSSAHLVASEAAAQGLRVGFVPSD